MTNRTKLGLSILAGAVSFVGSAGAVDIVIDGSYESSTNNLSGFIGTAGDDFAGIDGGWTHYSTYTYSANYTQPGPTGSGQVYLRPYNTSGGSQTVYQTNSLVRAITPAQIDGSEGQYTVSAWFSTYMGQNDYSDLTLLFLDASQAPVGSPISLGGAAFVAALPGGSDLRAWGKDTKSGLVPPGARYAAIWTESHAMSGQPDGYVDLVSLDISVGFVPVQLGSPTPADNAAGVSPGVVVGVTLQDGSIGLDTNSVQFTFDGSPVAPVFTKVGGGTRVEYDPPGLLAPLSTHTFQVAYNTTGGATPNATNQFTFTVAPWANINLGAPIHLETFDSIAEGSLPAGWSVQNFTDPDLMNPGIDLSNVRSDAYLDWVLISRERLENSIIAANPEDFAGTTNVAPNQVINGEVVTNLISGNFIWAVSARVDGNKEIQYLFTSDYNLSGQNNVYLSFHNILTQNQDSLESVEYSIDGGNTWVPALYLLNRPAILRDSQGYLDASNTLAMVRADVPDIDAGTAGGGYFGRYIGVAQSQWAGLGPFIQGRVDDSHTQSKRVEVIRLVQADNQPAVRFRFAYIGAWSWYFGIDNFGLYSIPSADPPVVSSPTPAAQTVAVGTGATFSIADPIGLGPFTYQWRHYGTNLPGGTDQVLGLPSAGWAEAGPYDVVVTGPGGSATSAPPVAQLSIAPVLVTGQWDFNGDLAATQGADLQYFDATVQADSIFGTTTSLGIPDINGQPTTVLRFSPTASSWGGYIMPHGAAPNGGGAYVNQYTLIYDLWTPDNDWRSLLQTGVGNTSDGDLFIDPTSGVGISQVYEGSAYAGEWHRIALAMDLSGPVLVKFIDGVKVGAQTTGLSAIDGRFSLDPTALLFADQDGDIRETYVSSVQFSNGRRSDAYLAALGGPSAAKIPGAIKVTLENGRPVIRWTGGVPLQSADSIIGPWSEVPGATSPYTPPAGATAKFYAPKIL